MLLCPHVVTGGPEAIHQLSDAILGFGGEVIVAYYGNQVGLSVEDNGINCAFSGNPTPQPYRDYRAIVASRIPLTERSLVLYPESVLSWAAASRPFNVGIWWVSVDNAIVKAPQLAYDFHRNAFLSRPNLIHYFQSAYAHDYLIKGGARQIFPLADYINQRYLDAPRQAPRDQSITYFPRKGGALASVFFDSHPDLNRIPIENMPAEAVHETLLKSQIYIDFGHHPGKDRIPREAAMSGNVVFLHERGAAAFHLDHPLDRFFLFTSADVSNGSLYERVRKVLAEPEKFFASQSTYHSRIYFEREEFLTQVKMNFFEPVFTR
ncbi:MAG: hypothetical protein RLZ07_1791 [Pseudomonadota bacterium]